MHRPLLSIALAIRLGQPDVTEADAQRYAVALQQQAKQHDFDPLTGVSMIYHESRFRPHAVSRDAEDYGLAQIRARFIGACKDDAEPLRRPSAACQAVKESLLQPEENIRVMAELITRHRAYCKKKVKSDKLPRWLASYQGRNNLRKKSFCQPGKGTWRVIDYRRYLIREVARRSRPITTAKR